MLPALLEHILPLEPGLTDKLTAGIDVLDVGFGRGKALNLISSELYWLPMFTYAKYYVFSKDLDFKTTSDEIPRFYTAKWK